MRKRYVRGQEHAWRPEGRPWDYATFMADLLSGKIRATKLYDSGARGTWDYEEPLTERPTRNRLS